LNNQPPSAQTTDAYTSDANATPPTDYTGNTGAGGLWGNASQWQWNWNPPAQQPPAGSAVSYASAPLAANTTVIGGGAVRAWVKSSAPDVDLQATISEVRPDGKQTFVQNGWIRASERKLSTTANNMLKQASTTLEPIPTFLASDAQPMPAGQFAQVVIPLYFEGHVYRAGSRIKISIAAPNGTQPIWAFSQTVPAGTTAQVAIASSGAMPSGLTLPVVPGVSVPTALPACPSLRNEPCR
jgi:predicted acyl esterase